RDPLVGRAQLAVAVGLAAVDLAARDAAALDERIGPAGLAADQVDAVAVEERGRAGPPVREPREGLDRAGLAVHERDPHRRGWLALAAEDVERVLRRGHAGRLALVDVTPQVDRRPRRLQD